MTFRGLYLLFLSIIFVQLHCEKPEGGGGKRECASSCWAEPGFTLREEHCKSEEDLYYSTSRNNIYSN